MEMPSLRLSRVEFLPELRLYLFDASTGLFDPAGGEYRSDRQPPFWAFAWAGGPALARYLLDHPAVVAGRRGLDFGPGSRFVAIAAAKAGASHVTAAPIAPSAAAALAAHPPLHAVQIAITTPDPTH